MVEALVEFDYFAQAPDELTLKKGDIITAILKEPGNGWWEGSLKGRRGLFPDNFVKESIRKKIPALEWKRQHAIYQMLKWLSVASALILT